MPKRGLLNLLLPFQLGMQAQAGLHLVNAGDQLSPQNGKGDDIPLRGLAAQATNHKVLFRQEFPW